MNTDKKSLYDLSIDYIKDFYSYNPNNKEKKKIISKFKEYLSKGWNQSEIFENLKSLNDRSRFKNDCYLDKALKLYKYDIKNLLHPDEIYYHKELRIYPKPPTMNIDYNSGAITSSESEEFLEMRASYTVEDLYLYFISKEDMYIEKLKDKKQFVGSLKWLLSRFEVDEILFMIDKADSKIKNDRQYLKLKSPLDLKQFVEDGEKALTSKKNALIYNGANNIIPKDRKDLLEDYFNKGE